MKFHKCNNCKIITFKSRVTNNERCKRWIRIHLRLIQIKFAAVIVDNIGAFSSIRGMNGLRSGGPK